MADLSREGLGGGANEPPEGKQFFIVIDLDSVFEIGILPTVFLSSKMASFQQFFIVFLRPPPPKQSIYRGISEGYQKGLYKSQVFVGNFPKDTGKGCSSLA